MNDGIIPTAPHRGQIAHYANPNLHKKWTSQLVTDYWGGAQAAAAAGDGGGQDRGHDVVGQGFDDDARPRTGWSVAPSEYPSTAATSRPRTSATLAAATGAAKWHPSAAVAEQGTAGRGGSGLTEEKLLVVGLMSENEELRRVCGELQDRVEQSLEALKLAAHDVQQVASYARELENGSANRTPRDVMILGDEVGDDDIISTASAHRLHPDARHHGKQPSRQARLLALPLGGHHHHQLEQQQQQQGRPGYLTERGMGMAAVAEEGEEEEEEQAIGGYGANRGKSKGNLTDRGPGGGGRAPLRMGTDKLGTLTPRSSVGGGGRAGTVGARLQTPRLSTSTPRGRAWIPAAAAAAAAAARPGTAQTGQDSFRPGTGQSAASLAASAASRDPGEGSGARPGTGRRAAAMMDAIAKGGAGGVGGGVSWSRVPRMMARRGSSRAGGGRLGGVEEEEERMGAASVLFGGDDIKRERVLSAYSARPGTGASRMSKALGARAAAAAAAGPEGQGRGRQEGGVSQGVSRRMRAMQEEGAGIQSRSGLLEATGKQPGDYWWDGRGPGIRRQNNFERRGGHYPVCLAMPACMPDPKPR